MFCNKCGSKVDEDSLFCTVCGTKIVTDSELHINSEKKDSEGRHLKEIELIQKENNKVKGYTDNKKKNIKSHLIILCMAVAAIICFLVYILQNSESTSPIIGEWQLSGFYDEQIITIEQMEAVGIVLEGQALFSENGFKLSVDDAEIKGTWEEIQKEDTESFAYELSYDEGGSDFAIIDKNEMDTLYVSLDYLNDGTLIIYKRKK